LARAAVDRIGAAPLTPQPSSNRHHSCSLGYSKASNPLSAQVAVLVVNREDLNLWGRAAVLRFDANAVVYGVLQSLPASQVVLRRLNAHMAKQELDLLQLAAGNVAEPRTCAAQVVGRELGDSGLGRTLLYHGPDDLFGNSGSPNRSALVYAPEDSARSRLLTLLSNHPRLL